ncbi:MAG TPA: hypothetical protein ENK14_13370 [Caldithrix sp.]|nr:hypothetical protein [Caldithrix sp.]
MMTVLPNEVLHALKMAMQNESDTIRVYQHMFKKVKNSKTRQMLRHLINEEHFHEQRIKEKYREGGGQFPLNEWDSELPNREQLLDIELENLTVLELINLAMQVEKVSRDFYKVQYKRAADVEVKLIFDWLARQEEDHIKSLQQEYESHQNYHEVRLSDLDEEVPGEV